MENFCSWDDRGFRFRPIGFVESVFQEKFGTPRQSQMLSEARGVLRLVKDSRFQLAVQELEGFSHLWIVFVFHQDLEKLWHPMVMPPRVEKPNRVGVFASRSPHRPNPIGMTIAKLEGIKKNKDGEIQIELSGIDLLDGTPVLDIKPYIRYADSIPEARDGWVDPEIKRYAVKFSETALQFIENECLEKEPRLLEFFKQVIELDPRPTTLRRRAPMESGKAEGKIFAFRLQGYHIRCRIQDASFFVTDIEALSTPAGEAALS